MATCQNKGQPYVKSNLPDDFLIKSSRPFVLTILEEKLEQVEKQFNRDLDRLREQKRMLDKLKEEIQQLKQG